MDREAHQAIGLRRREVPQRKCMDVMVTRQPREQRQPRWHDLFAAARVETAGYDNGDRRFRGLIDEVCVWNTNLTQEEVRELMHLTKKPSDFPDLLAYYQFNEPGGAAYDGVASGHLSLVGSADRTASTAP